MTKVARRSLNTGPKEEELQAKSLQDLPKTQSPGPQGPTPCLHPKSVRPKGESKCWPWISQTASKLKPTGSCQSLLSFTQHRWWIRLNDPLSLVSPQSPHTPARSRCPWLPTLRSCPNLHLRNPFISVVHEPCKRMWCRTGIWWDYQHKYDVCI